MILSFLIPGWGLSFSDLDQQVGRLLPPTIAMSAEIEEATDTTGQESVPKVASSTDATAKSTDSPASTTLTPTSARIAQRGPRLSIGVIVLIAYGLVTSLLVFRLLLQGLRLGHLVRHAAAVNADVGIIRTEVCHRLKLKRELPHHQFRQR